METASRTMHGSALPAMGRQTVVPIWFEATGMTVTQIREKIRELGWSGCHIDIQRMLRGDGRIMVTRIRA